MTDVNQELKRLGAELSNVAEDWMEDPPRPGMQVAAVAVMAGIALLRSIADEAEALIVEPAAADASETR